MVFVSLGLVKVPNRGLLAVGVPSVLAVLKETVKHGFVLPLIIRAPKNKTVLRPYTNTRKMESCVNKCLAESKPLGVCVEYVSGTAVFCMRHHISKGFIQEIIKLLVFHTIVFDSQTTVAFKGYSVGRVCYDKVRAFAVHKGGNVSFVCSITANKSVSANYPHIAFFHEGGFFKGCGKVVIVILNIGFITAEKVRDFVLSETREGDIKRLCLQGFNLHSQDFFIPPGIKRHAVIRNYVGFFLRLGKMVNKHARHLVDTFLSCRHYTAVSRDNTIIAPNNNGIDKTELTKA